MRVYLLGAGKVGRALSRSLRRGGVETRLRPLGRGLPARSIDADLLILAVRDGAIPEVAASLAAGPRLAVAAAVHCAGALGPEVLAPLAGRGIAVGQLHPLVSLADARGELAGYAHVAGDDAAVRLARRAARAAGLTPFTIAGVDRMLYHASAALLANGAAALAAAAEEGLVRAGCAADLAPVLLGALLASVADNVTRLGLPAALTGPVRRGDASAVAGHLRTLARVGPRAVELYSSAARSQVPLARALGEAPADALDSIEQMLTTR